MILNQGPANYELFCDFLTGVQPTKNKFLDFFIAKNVKKKNIFWPKNGYKMGKLGLNRVQQINNYFVIL